jgi:hypothetical protein
MHPHRRQFIGLSAAGLTVAALGGCRRVQDPPVLRLGWIPPRDGAGAVGLVREAWWRAARAGEPLLVVAIPEDQEAAWAHGTAWGELLNHGSLEALANLAVCQVVCAPRASAREALAGLPGGLPDARVALLVETREARALPVDTTLEPIHFDWNENEAHERAVRERMARLAADLAAVIAPDRDTLERRAREAGADPAGPRPRATHEAPSALLRLLAEDEPAYLAALAERARDALTEVPPSGTRWAWSTGCGVEVEGAAEDERMRVACGMGHTPAISQRFLYFFKDA